MAASLPIARQGHLHDGSFTVLGETDDFLAVDKPAHLLVHPTKPGQPPTLWDGLRELLAYELANGGQVSIITRLDRETSGVVLVAKHAEAAREAHLATQAGALEKEYLALVRGWPEEEAWEVDEPILRQGEVAPSTIWVRQCVHPAGKPCLTRFRVEARFLKADQKTNAGEAGRFALVGCQPKSGRMHQIRVHLAWSGHPVVGDKIYGPEPECYLEFIETGWTPQLEGRLLLPRQALHASRLRWPEQGLDWRAPLPSGLKDFMVSSED